MEELKLAKHKLFSSPKIARHFRTSVDPMDNENLSDWEETEESGWGCESFDSDDDRCSGGEGKSPRAGHHLKPHFRGNKDGILWKFHHLSRRRVGAGEATPENGGNKRAGEKSPCNSGHSSPKGSPRLPRAIAKNVEGAREVLKKKVSETARVWSASSGVSNLIGGHQHQRLMGTNGEDLQSPTSPNSGTYQSSPTLMERSLDKGANFFGGNDNRYQRLENPTSDRKDSWGDGWGSDWGVGDKESLTKKKENELNSPKEQSKQVGSKMSFKSSNKEKKSDGSNLLLDFDSPASSEKDAIDRSGPGTVHTWDNWDDDGWEKIE